MVTHRYEDVTAIHVLSPEILSGSFLWQLLCNALLVYVAPIFPRLTTLVRLLSELRTTARVMGLVLGLDVHNGGLRRHIYDVLFSLYTLIGVIATNSKSNTNCST